MTERGDTARDGPTGVDGIADARLFENEVIIARRRYVTALPFYLMLPAPHSYNKRQIRTLKTFRHRCIVLLMGYSNDGPSPCLVFEYMRNGNLQQRLRCLRRALRHVYYITHKA